MPKMYVKLSELETPQAQQDPGQAAAEEQEQTSGKLTVKRKRIRVGIQNYKKNHDTLNKVFHVSLLVTVLLTFAVALKNAGNIGWFFEPKTVSSGPLGEASAVLAPLIALALAIERLVETFFDYFEGKIIEVAKLSNFGEERYQKLEAELHNAITAYEDIAEQLTAVELSERSGLMERLAQAEAWVENINQRVADILKDPLYLTFKRRLSVWIGFSLGFIVAILTDKGIFEYLQISVPRIMDMLITGAVLGAGVGPMHSLVGLLDGLKTTVQNFRLPVAAKSG